jgi:hypothetical protein
LSAPMSCCSRGRRYRIVSGVAAARSRHSASIGCMTSAKPTLRAWPGPNCVAGKVNSADKFYLVIEFGPA